MSRALVAVLVVAACTAKESRSGLVTTAETSHYVATGRYDEAVRLCHNFAHAYSQVRCERIGTSGEGRPIVALQVGRGQGRPTIYLQAGIHAGEIEGKDAGFWFLRDLLDGKVAQGALDVVGVVFVPIVNPDGHERFGPNNRPNQRGPAEMGFRTTAARLNMNRDFVKADTPEMHAILHAFTTYRPVLFVDLHTTLDRGAIFVPIDQPSARLVLQLFEPALPDSLVRWGLFNTVFERKEYMEPYVAEQVAREMLAADPSLQATFDAALAADPVLAKSPALRLEWFYKRHPSWDERVNLLPIYRAAQRPGIGGPHQG